MSDTLADIGTLHMLTPETIFGLIDVHARTANRIVEVGCKPDRGAVELARRYPDAIVEQVNILRDGAPEIPRANPMPENLTMRSIAPDQPVCEPGGADVIVACSMLERVATDDLPLALSRFHEALAPGGIMISQVAPLYFSPFGSGVPDEDRAPWEHLSMPPVDFARRILDRRGESGRADHDRFLRRSRVTAPALRGEFKSAGFLEVYAEMDRAPLRPPLRLRLRHSGEALRTAKVLLVNRKPA